MEGRKNITLTYLNVRQSISILIFKLVFIDLFFAGVVIGAYFLMTNEALLETVSLNPNVFLITFVTLGVIKLLLGAYAVLLWLNEYYEITPEFVTHKKGIVHRTQEKYKLENLRKIKIDNTLFGEIFNFGTVSFYDIRLNKYLDMYLIHNPDRYANIFKKLIPDIEVVEDRVWFPFLKKGKAPLESLED